MITNTRIAFGDQLGAQMSTLADLYYISKKNNQDIVFFKELKNFKRGYQILDYFDLSGISIIDINNKLLDILDSFHNINKYKKMSWNAKMSRIYKSKIHNILDKIYYELFMYIIKKRFNIYKLPNGLNCENELLSLDKNLNYDIQSGYGTYQDWKIYEQDIVKLFSFKQSVIDDSNHDSYLMEIINNYNSVSVHFRYTDYLVMSSLCLPSEYYKKAIERFSNSDYFIVFSDDIQLVKDSNIFDRIKNVYYVENKSAGCDLYYMSKCKNNIIANSSFSFWGALLNRNISKKVICPYECIGYSSQEYMYMNGNWYPEDWDAIRVLV